MNGEGCVDGIDLGGNELSGIIPPELGNLSYLIELRLNGNELTGTVPLELGNLSNLSTLRLDNNNLSGCIPDELMSLCYLTTDEIRTGNESCNREYQGCQYDFRNNPLLPWQGGFRHFCDGEDPVGAPCMVDGQEGVIDTDCHCIIRNSEDIIFKQTSYITPDGDGVNDVLRFTDSFSLFNSEIYIYNRWGDEIYHTRNYQNNWDADGYPDGVYYYVLMYNGNEYKSSITVVR